MRERGLPHQIQAMVREGEPTQPGERVFPWVGAAQGETKNGEPLYVSLSILESSDQEKQRQSASATDFSAASAPRSFAAEGGARLSVRLSLRASPRGIALAVHHPTAGASILERRHT